MIGRPEIERSLRAAWGVFLGRADAMRGFDTGIEGFWRSFQAILLVAPFYVVLALGDRQTLLTDALSDETFDEARFWLAEAVTLATDWVALPLLLAAIGGFIGIRRDYAAFIVARNWATVIVIVPTAAVTLLGIVLGFSPEAALVPALLAFAFSLRFSYQVARTALRTTTDVAIAIVVLDVLMSLAIVRLIGRLFGVEI